MKTSLTKVMALAGTFCVLAANAPLALAGGSSYSFYSYAHSGVLQSGDVLPGALQLNLQTYVSPYFPEINQLRINTVKVSCLGDDALESAQLKLNRSTLAEASFTPSAVAPHWYGAILRPTSLMLQNDSVYNLSVDLRAKADLNPARSVICKAEVIDHDQYYNGLPTKSPETGLSNIDQEARALIAVVPAGSAILNGQSFRMMDAENSLETEPDLMVRGKVTAKEKNAYQLTVTNTDWAQEGMYNIIVANTIKYDTRLPDEQPNSLIFDITSPLFFTAEEQRYSQLFRVVEAHLYDSPADNGAIGSIVLERK